MTRAGRPWSIARKSGYRFSVQSDAMMRTWSIERDSDFTLDALE
jgi:hypothetical protein